MLKSVTKIVKSALLGAAVTVAVLTGAQAQTVASLPAPTETIAPDGRKAKPVAAWVDFCQREPAECAINANEPAVITMTPKIWNQIVQTNRQVNKKIQPMTDQDHWGTADHWDLPTDGYGDCEDYQLLKRKILSEKGLSHRAMRMTVVIDEEGEGHAVLMIRTTQGDYILDNKTNAILSWNETPYTYVKQEGNENQQWVSLGGVASPTTTANR